MKYDTADDRLIRVGDAYKYWKDRAVTMTDNENARIFRMMMDEVPAAKTKTGKWIYKTTDAYIQRTCNACGWSERIYHRNQDGLIRNYCPNCGSRNEVSEE